MTAPLPWFRHAKNLPGDYLVTWWVPVRNRRGTVTLDPRSLRFADAATAIAAGKELAHASYTTYREKGGKMVYLAEQVIA